MAQREPARRQTAGEPPKSKVTMRLGRDGRWVAHVPEPEGTPTSEPAERPPTPEDPRGPFAGEAA